MSKDAAKATAGLITLQRLNEVIIEKPDSPDLQDERKSICENNKPDCGCLLLRVYNLRVQEGMRWCVNLVGFDSSGQLWSKINVVFLCWVVDINQHLTLGIRHVQSIIDVCPAALL